jgi:hypothetical protein
LRCRRRRRSTRRHIRPDPIRETDSSPASSTRDRQERHAPGLVLAEADRVRFNRGAHVHQLDLAFGGKYVYQGNFSGFTIWDVSNSAKPVRVSVYPCVTSQGDPSIYGNLLFISAEGAGNRVDCAKGGITDSTDHKSHMAGVRIFDVSDPKHPKLVKNVQTCKGSHTHTIIPSPTDKGVIYIYVSGSQAARPEAELAGCKNGTDAGRRDELDVSARRDQSAARESGAGSGRDRERASLRACCRHLRVLIALRTPGAEGVAGAADAEGATERPLPTRRHRPHRRGRGTATT